MKGLAILSKVLCAMFSLLFVSSAIAQGKALDDGFTLLQILPAITFILALFTGGISLYTVGQLRKSKDEILTIVRAEIKNEIHELENRMAVKESEGREINKERIMNLKESLENRLTNILEKVNALGK